MEKVHLTSSDTLLQIAVVQKRMASMQKERMETTSPYF